MAENRENGFSDMDEDVVEDMFRTVPRILRNVILTGKPTGNIQSSNVTMDKTEDNKIPQVSRVSIVDYHPNGYGLAIDETELNIQESEETDMGLLNHPKKNNRSIVNDVKKKQGEEALKKKEVTTDTKQVTVEQVAEFITSDNNKSEGLGTINGYNIQPVSDVKPPVEFETINSPVSKVLTAEGCIEKITSELEEILDSDTLSEGEKIATLSLVASKCRMLLKGRYDVTI